MMNTHLLPCFFIHPDDQRLYSFLCNIQVQARPLFRLRDPGNSVRVIVSALVFYGIRWASIKMMRNVPFQYSFLLSIFLGIAAAVIFQPLRTGTLSLIERIYFGERLDYYKSLRNFSESLTTVVELDSLAQSTMEKLTDTFELEWVVMMVIDYSMRNYKLIAEKGFLLDGEVEESGFINRNSEIIKSIIKKNRPIILPQHGETRLYTLSMGSRKYRPALILPLRFKDKLNGFICLGGRKDKEFFDQFDMEILEILAGQCSVALENAISFEKVRRQQKRLQSMNKELIIGRNKPCQNCMAQDSLHTQLPFGVEMVDEKGGIIYSIHYYPISVPVGSEKIFLEFFQDIIQQKRLQQELI